MEQSDVARPQSRVDLTFLNSVSARPWDGPKKVRDVRIVLPDVSSPSAMAEAEAIGKGRRLHISKADIMKHGLTEGCLGCGSELKDTLKDAVHDSKLKSPRTEEGRARLTTAYLRSLPRDEGREPGAGAEAPAAVPAPPRSDEVQDEPMNAREASRKRSAQDAGHEADDAGRGGAQPDPGSMVDDSARAQAASRGARSRCCGTGRGVFAGEPAASRRIRIECRCGNGSAFGMGSGAANRPGQS